VLARAGFGSRRASEELIRARRVVVNGAVAELGSRVGDDDVIEVDGVRISTQADLVYIALNKPTGVVTTAKDPHHRRTVLDLVDPEPRVFSVGRLDIDTSGLLFLTNDGAFAERVAHPRYEITKTYVAEVRGKLPPGRVTTLRKGIELDDGVARADAVSVKATKPGRTVVEITVREGRNRLVRRMLAASGVEVVSLVRTAIGPVQLGRLKPGTWRRLRAEEVLRVMNASSAVH
jgi:23S rRNA pseudouridine2605 synthase